MSKRISIEFSSKCIITNAQDVSINSIYSSPVILLDNASECFIVLFIDKEILHADFLCSTRLSKDSVARLGQFKLKLPKSQDTVQLI